MKLYSIPRIATATALAVTLLAGMTACSAADAKPSIVDNGTPVASKATRPADVEPAELESLRGTLVEIISGDTVVLKPVSEEDGSPTGEQNITVNILGMSAPAIGECGGPEASAELKRIIKTDGFFRVNFDPNVPSANSEGQIVGQLISSDGSGTPSLVVNDMVGTGYASAWHEGDTAPKGFEDLVEATAINKAQKRGLWETCDTVGLGSSIPAAKKPTGPNS